MDTIRFTTDSDLDVPGYLARLGLERPIPPSSEGLRMLHRAHVERVPFETLWIHLGDFPTVSPYASSMRFISGRGGYCVQLNGGFALLLAALGYDVELHVGWVRGEGWTSASIASPDTRHLALTVACDGQRWFVDAGLGDALHEPLPLCEGQYQQGPFTYLLTPWDSVPGGWRFHHDQVGSFVTMEFDTKPATMAEFAASHRYVMHSPESAFLRVATVQRRDAKGIDVLRGLDVIRIDESGQTRHEIDAAGDWFGVIADVFGMSLKDVAAEEKARLWDRVRAQHEQLRNK